MFKTAAMSFVLVATAYSAEFVHPAKFTGTKAEKEAVLAYIVEHTKAQYSAIGMDNPTTLRMMEKENLNAFMALTQAKDIQLLNRTIQQYCAIGMCNYQMINLMYNQEASASQQVLAWGDTTFTPSTPKTYQATSIKQWKSLDADTKQTAIKQALTQALRRDDIPDEVKQEFASDAAKAFFAEKVSDSFNQKLYVNDKFDNQTIESLLVSIFTSGLDF